MNTKNIFFIESLIGLGATMLIVAALGFYMLNEQDRIAEAQAQVLSIQLDESMTLYAENCSVCHGMNGEGMGQGMGHGMGHGMKVMMGMGGKRPPETRDGEERADEKPGQQGDLHVDSLGDNPILNRQWRTARRDVIAGWGRLKGCGPARHWPRRAPTPPRRPAPGSRARCPHLGCLRQNRG